jgi:bacillithiol biosynthesis cysteine-adding enzyme BshC
MRIETLPVDALPRSALAAALLADPTPPWSGGLPLPARIGEFRALSTELRRAARPRAALAAALERGLAPHAPHARVRESLRRLAGPDALAVVTGQQPGLLGGPLYCLHKALHAIVLARALEAELGVPVVPVYWNHADDHDIAEVHHAWLMNEHFDWRKIGLSGVSSGRTPIGELPLSDAQHRLGAIGQLLLQLLPSRPTRAAAIEQFLPREGETLASAFTRAFTRLLGPHGLVLLEPAWIRAELAPVLAHIATRDVRTALARGQQRIEAAGHAVAIDAETAALLFEHTPEGRRAWRAVDGGWLGSGDDSVLSGSALSARIAAQPNRWSAAALTRPLAQDLVLPVAAYVGGLGELAYHVQLAELRSACGAPLTPFVPRVSLTLVTSDVAESLRSLELTLEGVLRSGGRIEDESDAPERPAVIARLSELGARAARELSAERDALAELDPGLAIQLRQTADQIKQSVQRLVEKAERVDMNRRGRGSRHTRRVSSTLFPREAPQERVSTAFEWIAKHGEAWIHELAAELPPLPRAPLAVHLETEVPA